MKGLRTAAFALALVGAAGTARAHPVPFSYLDVRLEPASLDITLVAHVFDVAHEFGVEPSEQLLNAATLPAYSDRISALIGARLQIDANGRSFVGGWSAPEVLAERQSLKVSAHYDIGQSPGSVTVTAHLFPYDPAHQTFVNVYEQGAIASQVILDVNRPRFEYFAGGLQGVRSVLRRFMPDGVRHILSGPEHLLFLGGLLLMGGTWRQLLLVASAFTIAHVITLSLAAFNVLNAPARLIEPAIALTIVYVGVDNLLVRDGRDMRAWIALAFGCIHGFGFAAVLRAMELPARALGWSLFSFNFGIEIGQLVVMAIVGASLAMLRARSAWAGRQLVTFGSFIVVAAGTYWFIERVFFPGGPS